MLKRNRLAERYESGGGPLDHLESESSKVQPRAANASPGTAHGAGHAIANTEHEFQDFLHLDQSHLMNHRNGRCISLGHRHHIRAITRTRVALVATQICLPRRRVDVETPAYSSNGQHHVPISTDLKSHTPSQLCTGRTHGGRSRISAGKRSENSKNECPLPVKGVSDFLLWMS